MCAMTAWVLDSLQRCSGRVPSPCTKSRDTTPGRSPGINASPIQQRGNVPGPVSTATTYQLLPLPDKLPTIPPGDAKLPFR